MLRDHYCVIVSLNHADLGTGSFLNKNCSSNLLVQIQVKIKFQDAIHRIKVAFNKEFMNVYQNKEQEVARAKEKNIRIREIMQVSFSMNLLLVFFLPSVIFAFL